MSVLIDGYWCEAIVSSPEARAEWTLAGYRAATPDEALSWLLTQAGDLVRALESGNDPELDGAGASRGVAHVFRRWARDSPYHQVQLDALETGDRISANARCRDRVVGQDPVEVFYTLSARPITVPFGRQRRLAETLPGGPGAHARDERRGVTFLDTV